MKILILGCGYVGTAITQFWHKAGHRVTVTTTTPEKVETLAPFAHQGCVMEGDDLPGLTRLVQDQELVLCTVGAKAYTTDDYRRTYLHTAQNLTQAIAQAPTVQQVIYTSTYSVIGDYEGQWTDENYPPRGQSDRSQILIETEQTFLQKSPRHCRPCVLRLGGIYGPGRELRHVYRRWFGETRPGDGSEYSNWSHLTDIIGGIDFARSQQLNGLFNLVSDRPIRKRELLEQLAKKYNQPAVTWDPQNPDTQGYSARVSNQKLKNLGFQCQYPEVVF